MKTKAPKFPDALRTVMNIDGPPEGAALADYAAMASAIKSFACLGLNHIAYTRMHGDETLKICCIYSASGHLLEMAPTLEVAWGNILLNDMKPVFVH